LETAAILKQREDQRMAEAQARIAAKQDTNQSLTLVDEFEQGEQEIFDRLVTENKLGDADFKDLYNTEVQKLQSSIKERGKFSSSETTLDFENKLMESQFKIGDDRAIANTTALNDRMLGLGQKRLRQYQLSPERKGEGFNQIISGARDIVRREFGPSLPEAMERQLINEVVINQFEPQYSSLIAGQDYNGARLLLENDDVSETLTNDQWRAYSQRIELAENKVTELAIENIAKDTATAERLGKPVSQLTPTEIQEGRGGKDSTFKARELVEKAKVMFKTENPSSEQIQQAARLQTGQDEPNKLQRDIIFKADAEEINKQRGPNREVAESNLQNIRLAQTALSAKGPDGKPAFEPGAFAELRTGISRSLKIFGVTQDQIDKLPFKLGDATMSDLLSKPMAQLALNQAEKISRVTNMSLTLVREALGTIGTDPEGLNVMLGLASMIEERQLSISELADKAAAKIRNPESPGLKNFDYVSEVSNLKQEWGEKMEEQLSTILVNSGKAPGAAAPEAEKTAVSPEDRALVGKPFAQGSKILGIQPDGRVLVEKADGQQGTVPREAVDRWLQEQGGETAPEGEPQGSSLPRPPEATSPEAVEGPEASPEAPLGLREDGTPKGQGFLGPRERPDGGVSTELSVGVEIDGQEVLIPTMVPGLEPKEIEKLLEIPEGGAAEIPREIIDKAITHAEARIAEGKSPFLELGEEPLAEPQEPIELDQTTTPDVKPRTPAKKDVAKKPGKFTDAEAVAGLDDEAFERFISTTPASKRSANVNKVVADRVKAQLRSKSGEAEKDFSTPAKVKKMIPKVTKGTAEQTKIFKALVDQESGSRVGLTSKAGAKGLAQIMPGTAKLIAEKSGLGFTKEQILTDPEANLKAGFWLLFKDTFPRFKKTDDQLAFSLADYNANPSLRKARAKLKGKDKNTWSKVEPMLPSETRAYVKSIKKRMGK
jgi:hypothetical protein